MILRSACLWQIQKLKLLRILKILRETDETSPLTASEIGKKLALYGIEAERKSICRDINVLVMPDMIFSSVKITRRDILWPAANLRTTSSRY